MKRALPVAAVRTSSAASAADTRNRGAAQIAKSTRSKDVTGISYIIYFTNEPLCLRAPPPPGPVLTTLAALHKIDIRNITVGEIRNIV